MDQTQFFKQCVDIYEDSNEGNKKGESKVPTRHHHGKHNIVNSEFYSKTTSIHRAVLSLMALLGEIRPQYLLANSRAISEDQKTMLDVEIKLKLQRLANQVKNLQDIDLKLERLAEDSEELSKALEKVGFSISTRSVNPLHSLTRNLISMGDYSEYVAIRNATLRAIFTNVVKSLALDLQKTMDAWNEMHDIRHERLLQLKKSTLSTSDIGKSTAGTNAHAFGTSSSGTSDTKPHDIDSQYVSNDYESLTVQLAPQELAQLQVEQDFLAEELKKGTLESVTNIEESMMDIASMVREIGIQLSTQNENISLLDAHKDEIVGNVKSGNTVLVKANESNSKRNKSLAWMIFIAALILLVVDYIL